MYGVGLGIIRHWSSRLLSFLGRTQLIKCVLFVIANYWTRCILIPKKVIKSVKVVCRTFLWARSDKVSRKSHIAWRRVCTPRK